MKVSKITIIAVLTGVLVLLPHFVMASFERVYSLSLNANDYWIVPDPINIFSNPAYINEYPSFVSVTAADYQGEPVPVGSYFTKLDDRISLGVSLGNPTPSFFNEYCSVNPGSTFQHFNSQVEVEKDGNYITPEAEKILTNNARLYLGYSFDHLKLGIATSYISLDSQDVTENPVPGNSEVKTTYHRNFTINIGLLTDETGPFDSTAMNISAEYPSLLRRYSSTTPTGSDNREINGTNASRYKLGLAGTILTSPRNYLTASFNYSAANYTCAAFEHLDNDGDGDFTDSGDVYADDSYLAQQYSIKYGLADRLDFENKGFAFIAVYGHIYKFKQYAYGYNTDGRYAASVHKSNRFTVPVILGAEINLTDWLTVRISGTKNIVSFTKWYDETSGETFTDYTSEDSIPAINGGLGIHYQNFSLDWLVTSPWSDHSDPLADSFNNNNLSTELSVSWRF